MTRITREDVIRHADAIAEVLNSGKVVELKIEKSEIAVIEIRRKLKKA